LPRRAPVDIFITRLNPIRGAGPPRWLTGQSMEAEGSILALMF
jgi:hypothetical protein